MKLAVRVALLALALAPIAAFGDNAPQVVVATPGVGDGAIERFTVRFNQPMVALGDPRAASPFDVECPVDGDGRWADQQTFVYEFATAAARRHQMHASRRATGLKSVSRLCADGPAGLHRRCGRADRARGAARRERRRDRGGSGLPGRREHARDRAHRSPPTPIARSTGIGEKIPVDVLPADAAGARCSARWAPRTMARSRSFLDSARPAQDAARRAWPTGRRCWPSVTALKCRRPLPPGRDMALVWWRKIASASGKPAGTDQRFDYTVRKPFAARFECSRVNAQAGCSPVEKAYRALHRADRDERRRRRSASPPPTAQSITPVFDKDEKKSATISDITFAGADARSTTAQAEHARRRQGRERPRR